MAARGVLRLAAGVILNLIISTNPFLAIILLQAIAFSRSSYLAGINVAVAYRMVINLLPLGEGWDGATICFFTANGGFLILFLVSLPPGGRGGGWWRISESTLSGISATAR